MRSPPFVRRPMLAGGLLILGLLAACTDAAPTAPAVPPAGDIAILAVPPSATEIVVPGADAGAFMNSILANESGWLTTEFWDNPSADGANCNVGFYATGAMGTCANEAAGSDAGQGGFTKYWGDGPDFRKSSSFMFSGAYAYKVTLVGHYAVEPSELGWFTVSGGVYTFHEVQDWSDEVINSFALIPAGANWGFYFKHPGHDGTSCAPGTDCSDATGDMHADTPPTQQFALFTNADEDLYLVGMENNDEGAVNIGDDDFQDMIFTVEPLGGMFVIGDVEDHAIDDDVYFWGSQWWRYNFMSGDVSSGVAAFKGYAYYADGECGGVWSTVPGNSPPPPAMIPDRIAIIVTSEVLKDGPVISGNIMEILIVDHDGNYSPNPGHAGRGPVTEVVCQVPD